MSKQKHRTVENLLIYPNGSGFKFRISKKIQNSVPSTPVFGRTGEHRVGSVQKSNETRVRALQNPGKGLTLKLKDVVHYNILRWEYGFEVEEPQVCAEFHVYSSEQKMLIWFCAEGDSGTYSGWRLCQIDKTKFTSPRAFGTWIIRNWSGQVVRTLIKFSFPVRENRR